MVESSNRPKVTNNFERVCKYKFGRTMCHLPIRLFDQTMIGITIGLLKVMQYDIDVIQNDDY